LTDIKYLRITSYHTTRQSGYRAGQTYQPASLKEQVDDVTEDFDAQLKFKAVHHKCIDVCQHYWQHCVTTVCTKTQTLALSRPFWYHKSTHHYHLTRVTNSVVPQKTAQKNGNKCAKFTRKLR